MTLESLEIHALRGATKPFTLSFEKNRKIAILYGENGSGKSTICDAIDLITHEAVGSLDGKGIGKTNQFWHSTGLQSAELKVVLKTSSGTWEGRVAKAKVVVSPNTPRPRAQILRRSQILNLIAGQPKDRFDAVRPFLDIENVETSEASLRKLLDQERRGLETALARLEENRAALQSFWEEAGRPGQDPIGWARIEVKKDISQLQVQINLLERTIQSANKVAAEQVRFTENKEALLQADANHSTCLKRVAEEQGYLAKDLGDFVAVLEAAQAYLSDREIDACPLCGSAELAAGLAIRVGERLSQVLSLRNAQHKLVEAERRQQSAQDLVNSQIAALTTAIRLLRRELDAVQVSTIELPQELRTVVQQLIPTDAVENNDIEATADLLKQIPQLTSSLQIIYGETADKARVLQLLKRAVETYDENYSAQTDLELLIPRLDAALSEIIDVRRQFVDQVLMTIAARVGELYEKIHPGEGRSKVMLLLDPNKRASLDIAVPFPGIDDAPPGAYFSESHLDTLGLCIWLALAEMDDSKHTILVLDDVIASVDEPHAERVVELLYEVAQNFQYCIYTTHYRPWREKYRWGWLNNGQCQFIELRPWQYETGMRHTKHVPPIEELRSLLAFDMPSPQLCCSSAGVILEALLDFLTEHYECSVPRRRGKPTLGDLLPSVKGRLRSTLLVERKETDPLGQEFYKKYQLGPMLDKLQDMAQARNIFGCHFNELSMALSENDAMTFAMAVLELSDLVVDVEAGWPKSDKSGMYWSNSGETRRLYPLRQPS